MPKNKGYSQQSSKPTVNRTAQVMRDRLAQETGTIRKDRGGRIPVALVFPNTYYIGMSSLGFQTIYRLFNDAPDIVCERAFLPDTDGQFEMPRNRGPIWSRSRWSAGRPCATIDVVAFSVSYELDYFNMVQILRAAGIPLLAQDRDETTRLSSPGAPASLITRSRLPTSSTWPLSARARSRCRASSRCCAADLDDGREAVLKGAARCSQGLYVPGFYDVSYHADGLFAGIQPNARHPAPEPCPADRQGAGEVTSALPDHLGHPDPEHRVRQQLLGRDGAGLRARLPLLPGELRLHAPARAQAGRPDRAVPRTACNTATRSG